MSAPPDRLSASRSSDAPDALGSLLHLREAGGRAAPAASEPSGDEARELLRSIGAACFAIGDDWRFRYVNDRAATLFGHAAAELVGQPVLELFPAFRDAPLHRVLSRAMAERTEAAGEEFSVAAQGWARYHVYPTGAGVFVFLHDVTVERRARDRARLLADASRVLAEPLGTEATLRALAALVIERIADYCIVHLVDADGSLRLVQASHRDAGLAALAWEVESRYPQRADSASGPAQVARGRRPRLVEVTDAYLQAIAQDAEHLAMLRRFGARWSLVVPLAARGRVQGTLACVLMDGDRRYDAHDVGLVEELAERAALALDNARLFEASEAARADAETANRAKTEFLATISHELRTPLTAIHGYTELLLEDDLCGPLSADQRDHLQRVRGASAHLLTLVEEVLGFARLQAGRAEVHVVPTDAHRVAEAAADLVRPMVERKGLRFSCEAAGGRLVLHTDCDKLRQIVVNLLSNAVKFTEHGEVRLAVRCDGPDVVYEVSDTGPGIAGDQIELIFEPFRQADQTLTRRAGGAGLGLALARRLARLLGGDVTVVSTPGAGSTFFARVARHYRSPPTG